MILQYTSLLAAKNKIKIMTIFNISNSVCAFYRRTFFAKIKYLLLFIILTIANNKTDAQISGTVFRDFNANGVRSATNPIEPFLSGITVKAYNAAGAEVGSTTTNASGAYSFTGLTLPLRIEFTGLQASDYTGPAGTGNLSSIQFYTAATTTANFGVNYPSDYCHTTNPNMVTSLFVSGDPLSGGTSGTGDVLVRFGYTNSGVGISTLAGFGVAQTAPSPTVDAEGLQIGSTWGIAYQKSTKTIFNSAFIKRHVGLGPLGEGGIYSINYSSGSPVVNQWLDVATIGMNVGTVGTGATFADRRANRNLNAASNQLSGSADTDAFFKVGRAGIGDIDISEDEKTLWVVNLFDRTLNGILIDSDGNPATAPTSADLTTFAIPNPCGTGTQRPFALKVYRGEVYIGLVCETSLEAYIYRFNGTAFTQVLVNGAASIPLNYTRGQISATGTCYTASGSASGNNGWFVWSGATPPAQCHNPSAANKLYVHPEPLLSDIEFDVDGSIILGIIDRSGHMYGAENLQFDGSDFETVHAGGDVLRVCNVGGNLFMQGSPGGCANNSSNNSGPNGGEFYHQDYLTCQFFCPPRAGEVGLHTETTSGGMALLPGSGAIAVASYDPFGTTEVSGGINWYNNTTGLARSPGYLIYFGQNNDFVTPGGFFGKANGIGDLELLCDAPPIEIGNRVWLDKDKDGIQDANEAGIANVSLNLYADFDIDGVPDGAILGTATTAANGTWYFNAANVTDGDPNVTGNQAGPQPDKNYIVRVAASDWTAGAGVADLLNLTLTQQNIGGAGQPDVRDNDAGLVGTIPQITILTKGAGENNHTFDMGFICPVNITNPSASQLVCQGGTFSDITVNVDVNTANIVRFVRFSTDQSAVNGSETAAELTAIYAGTTILATVTPTGSSDPYTATLTAAAAGWSALGAGTYYVYAIINPNPGGICRSVQEIIVTINGVTGGTVAAATQTVCSGGDPAAFTQTVASTGSGTLTYQWESSTTDCNTGFSPIAGAMSTTYNVPAGLTQTTYFRRVTTSTLNGLACTANSNCLTVFVNNVTASVVGPDQTVCAADNPPIIDVITPATGSGTLTYQWQSNTTGCAGTFTNIAGATMATYDPLVLSATTYYRVIVTSTLNSVACTATSNCVTVFRNNVTSAGTITASQTICEGSDPVAFNSTAIATGVGTISYQWQISTTSTTTGFTDIAGAISATYDAPGPINQTTYFRRVAVSTLNGIPCTLAGTALTITVNSVTAGVIAGDQTFCASPADPAAFTVPTAATGATLTYIWQSSTVDCTTGFANIAGATTATHNPPAGLTVTTYYRRITVSTLNTVACRDTSNCVTVAIISVTPGSIAGGETVCVGGDPVAFTETAAATGNGTISYQWQSSTIDCSNGFSNITGAVLNTYNPPAGITQTTYYRRVAISTIAGLSCTANSNCITVNASGIVLSAQMSDCFDSNGNTAGGNSLANLRIVTNWTGRPGSENITVNVPGATPASQTLTISTSSGTGYLDFEVPSNGAVFTASANYTVTTTCPAVPVNATAPNNNCLNTPCASGQTGGIVWQDYDNDGIQDAAETQGVAGVTVRAYDCNGNLVGTTTTDNLGQYTFGALVAGVFPIRVEFSNWPASYVATRNGTDGRTDVQFITAPECDVDFGVVYPDDYCQTNPNVAVPPYNVGPAAGTAVALIRAAYDFSGTPTSIANFGQVGATWGISFHRPSKTIFNSAYLKRHVGLAQGTGHIFMSNATTGFVGSFNLQGVNGINLGSVVRTTTAGDNQINATTGGIDLDAFAKVGKVGFGDIDLYNQKTLFAINLNARSLIAVDVSNISLLPTNGTAVSGSLVQEYPLSLPSCEGGVMRPFALKIYKGLGYIGAVCDASISQDSTDLGAFVYTFDPENPGSGLTGVLNFSLNYPRESTGYFAGNPTTWPGTWRSWKDTYSSGGERRVSPIFGDIEFTEDGSMIIGLLDRVGDQYGNDAPLPVSGSTTLVDKFSGGDILKACNVNGVFLMEGTSGACPVSDQNANDGLLNNGGSPDFDGFSGNGEFFYAEFFQGGDGNGHGELALGGLAMLPGTKEILSVMYDPTGYGQQGMARFSTATGARSGQIVLVPNPSPFNKANGLGDVELLCDALPIQIGNYVWVDTDADGVQDPCELPLAGVKVDLYKKDGTLIGQTTTSAAGEYYFDHTNVDTIAPYGTGGFTGMSPNTAYVIVLGKTMTQYNTATNMLTIGANTYQLTASNTGQGTGADQNDNDGTILSGINAAVNGYPGYCATTPSEGSNHTFDFGVKPPCSITVTSATPTACVPATNTYSLNVVVTYTNPPAGNITVTTTSGASITVAATTSPQTITITGILADGAANIGVTAFFVADPACTHTLPNAYNAPLACSAVCGIIVSSATPTACAPATNTYSLDVVVTYANSPGGNITINTSNGGTVTVAATTTPQTITLTGLASNGAMNIGVTAFFVSDPACTHTLANAYNAPASCVTVALSDPCVCHDVVYETTNDPLELLDYIDVTAPSGSTWQIISQTGLEEINASINIPLSVPATLTYMPGLGVYRIRVAHTNGVGYMATLSNGSFTLNISNLCTKNVPTSPALASTYCSSDPAVPLPASQANFTITYRVGDPATGTIVTAFDPALYAASGTVNLYARYMPVSASDCPITLQVPVTVVSPPALTATPGACVPATNQHTLTGSVTFTNPPASGTLTVQVTGGGSQVFNAPFISPLNYSIAGLPSDGASKTVTATFSASPACSNTAMYTAPASCTSVCTQPTANFVPIPARCVNLTPQDDGRIVLTAYTNTDRFGVSPGNTYTGPVYSAASTVTGINQNLQTGVPNVGGGIYTVRLFNGSNTCYRDYTITVPPGFPCKTDPMGYIYCEETGQIIMGGTITVTPPPGATYVITQDGSTGVYQFFTDAFVPGIYTMTYTPPAGYSLSTTRLPGPTLDPTGQPNPYILGSGNGGGNTLTNFTAAANPFYLSFNLTSGDPEVLNNNIPLKGCCIPPVLTTQNGFGLHRWQY